MSAKGEELKGRIKEAAGELVDDADLRRKGRLQQREAAARDELARTEEEAVRKAQEVAEDMAVDFKPDAGALNPAFMLHLGDVILSLDTARRQARAHRRTLAGELDLYLAHGLLHLLGHDHHRRRDAERMAALEARLLGRPGMVPGRP